MASGTIPLEGVLVAEIDYFEETGEYRTPQDGEWFASEPPRSSRLTKSRVARRCNGIYSNRSYGSTTKSILRLKIAATDTVSPVPTAVLDDDESETHTVTAVTTPTTTLAQTIRVRLTKNQDKTTRAGAAGTIVAPGFPDSDHYVRLRVKFDGVGVPEGKLIRVRDLELVDDGDSYAASALEQFRIPLVAGERVALTTNLDKKAGLVDAKEGTVVDGQIVWSSAAPAVKVAFDVAGNERVRTVKLSQLSRS